MQLAILLAASASTTPHFRHEIASILQLVAQTSGVPDENVSVFSFQGLRPALLCAGDCRANNAAADRLSAARAEGLTPLYDAIVFASDFVSQHGDPHAQKVLIVFSDGEDTISRHSLTEAIDAALAGNVLIYGVGLNQVVCPGSATLNRLAEATGGRYFPAQDGATRAVNVILEGFRATYVVNYRLPAFASGFRGQNQVDAADQGQRLLANHRQDEAGNQSHVVVEGQPSVDAVRPSIDAQCLSQMFNLAKHRGVSQGDSLL